MTWLLYIIKGEETVVKKVYRTACECSDAVLKAKAYYEGLNESVVLQMKSDEGHLVGEIKVN